MSKFMEVFGFAVFCVLCLAVWLGALVWAFSGAAA